MLLVALTGALPGCASELTATGARCATADECGDGDECIGGRCVAASADGGLDADSDADALSSVHDRLCFPCAAADDCGPTGSACLELEGESRCATPCVTRPCPSGFACQTEPVNGQDVDVCLPEAGGCAACLDPDGDSYGVGPECRGRDCDETRTGVHAGAAEVCDAADNDCDEAIDEDFGGNLTGTDCGACDSGAWQCVGGAGFECVGDRGRAARNSCGGCAALEAQPAARCGVCLSGRWACDGPDGIRCEGALGEGWLECGEHCCTPGQTCLFGACVDDVACLDDEECQNDTYCEPTVERCVPYDDGPRGETNPECRRLVVVGRFAPSLQCTWEAPPPGDAYPAWRHVLSVPLVADFDFENDSQLLRPSVVFTTDDGEDGSSELPTGLIRIVDGRTCAQQFSLDMQWTSHSSPPAVGDLDGDGTPEIVAYKAGGGLVAFHYVRAEARWEVLWTSHTAAGAVWELTGGGWGGPAIHDIDGDGVPEVLRGGVVFAADGTLVDASLGYLTHETAPANMSAVYDVDGDGVVELASGDGLWGWSADARTWQAEAYFDGTGLTRGHIAVVDLGEFPLASVDYPQAPEIVVVWSGQIRAQTIEGDVVFGPIGLPGGGAGGPPTAGDFDGDGRPELAAAGFGSYTVFDLDCTVAGTPETCASGRTDGILWTVPSQDFSSSSTGSSIFDFEGDGQAEAIYADECFVRVYRGTTGQVIFSQFRSSCTWHENPVVADVDGDFNSELIVPSNLNCGTGDQGRPCSGLDPGGLDPQFPGLPCEENADCTSGSCGEGYCRCTVTDECCLGDCGGSGFVCAPPPAGTPGAGNTCRAAHPTGATGIRIYSDTLDRWVNSRPIWNQHAYFVTNVADDATIPAAGSAPPNWELPGLNNFRQNAQGAQGQLFAPDLTSSGGPGFVCDAKFESAGITALVCNRGTEPVDSGVAVTFYDGTPETGTPICELATERPLVQGDCEPVSCWWFAPPTAAPGATVSVVADADNGNSECLEGNNVGVVPNVFCEP